MIELNLIDAAAHAIPQPLSPRAVSVPAEKRESSKKHPFLMALSAMFALLLVLFGVLKVVGLPQSLEGVLPAPILSFCGIEDPSRAGPALDQRLSGQMTTAGGAIENRRAEEEAAAFREAQMNSAERAVQEVQPGMFQGEKRSGYASLLPMEKILYQKTMAAQVFSFINAVTPDGVNFANLVFAAPNYYYIRGVAETPVALRSYLDRLRMGSSEFKTPTLPENAPATSLTAYGVISAKAELPASGGSASQVPFVKDAEIEQEIAALHGLDANGRLKLSGLKNPQVENFGVYKNYTYKVTTKADFQTVLHFLESLAKSPIRVGVENVKMSASGKNGVLTTMTLVVCATP